MLYCVKVGGQEEKETGAMSKCNGQESRKRMGRSRYEDGYRRQEEKETEAMIKCSGQDLRKLEKNGEKQVGRWLQETGRKRYRSDE